jgi:hypothetical protein
MTSISYSPVTIQTSSQSLPATPGWFWGGRAHGPPSSQARSPRCFDRAGALCSAALRALFLKDLLARPLTKEEKPGGLWDRAGNQRALSQTAARPAPQRRLLEICTPGYTGRKRGEVVWTRTTVL